MAAQMKTFKPQASAATVAAFDSSPANIDAKTQRLGLANGMKVALLTKPTPRADRSHLNFAAAGLTNAV